jgi:hypothetical protein
MKIAIGEFLSLLFASLILIYSVSKWIRLRWERKHSLESQLESA